MIECIEEKPPCLITQPLVLEVVERFGEPVDGAWSLCWLVLDQGEVGLGFVPNKAAFPRFQMPPAFAGTKGRCWMVRLAARPCGAQGCCCSKYCSVIETQSASPWAPLLGVDS